jgi:cytochrome c
VRLFFAILIGTTLLIDFSTFAADDITDRIATADVARGEKTFKKCKACHTIEKGGKNKIGPNLWGVVGREVASLESYEKYSSSLKNYGGVWTFERLDEFLTKPKTVVPKTRMTFPGLKKEKDRSDLLAFLDNMRENPTIDTLGKPVSPDQSEDDYGVLVNKPGVEETFNYCTACHSERIVAQQGLTREDWARLMVWMVEEQEMDEIEESDLAIILDYLGSHYNVDRPNFPTQ